MAHAVLDFNEQLERIGEVAIVVTVGMLLWAVDWDQVSWGFVAAVLLVIRPLAVAVGLAGSGTPIAERALVGWFGIRGIGSVFYLMFAINRGLDPAMASTLAAITLAVIAVSIVVHGISVTPLMTLYSGSRRGPGPARPGNDAP
jgi:NhaP-type Na+/H+ or K+/H+ antiporter